MQQPQGPGDKITMRDTTNVLCFLALCHSTCLSVFMRRGFGCEALGFNGFGAFIMLLLLWGMDHTGASMFFFWAWLGALICQRFTSMNNKRKGIITHSFYNGVPVLAMRFAKDEATAKKYIEPLFCLFAGILLLQVSESLGAFVMAGVASLTMVNDISRRIDEVRVQRMHDAAIDARRTAQMYRGNDS